jgi:hypothetical protein
MINFKEILEEPEVGKRVVTVNGMPVWDYKSSNFNVFLIYQNPWKGVEEECVTVDEIKNYLTDMGIPNNKAVFKIEDTREKLNIWRLSTELTINFKQHV